MMVDDEQLVRDVQYELGRDPIIGGTKLRVTVTDHVAVVSGMVPSAAVRDIALRSAARVLGIRRVFDGMEIAAVGASEEDSTIAASVDSILALDAAVPATAIDIEVRSGVVTLGGIVDFPYQAEAARVAASRIRGVKTVVSTIEVQGPPRVADVRARILAALEKHVEEQVARMEITVDHGHVRVGGRITSEPLHALVRASVQGAPGVTDVEDILDIVTASPDGSSR